MLFVLVESDVAEVQQSDSDIKNVFDFGRRKPTPDQASQSQSETIFLISDVPIEIVDLEGATA